MNLRLRRTLSSVLAFVMLCSCMVVANVGSVFAADTTGLKTGPITDEDAGTITTTWDFTVYTTELEKNSNWMTNEQYDGITVDTDEIFKPKTAGYLQFNENGKLYLPISEGADGGTVYVTTQNSDNKRKIVVGSNETQMDVNKSEVSCTYTSSELTNGTLALGVTGGSANVSSIKLVENIGDPNAPVTITLNDTANTNGTTEITVDGAAWDSATAYAKGLPVVVVTKPNEGYMATVTVNGKTVELNADGTYEFNLESATTIVVEYAEIVTGPIDLVDVIDLSAWNTDSTEIGSQVAAGNYLLMPGDRTADLRIRVGSVSGVNGGTVNKYVNFNGTGGVDDTAIKLNPTADGNLYVWARSSNNTTARELFVADKAYDVNEGNGDIKQIKVPIEANTDYYIYSTGGGINVYLVGTDVLLNTPDLSVDDSGAVDVYSGETLVGSYSTIQAAINAATAGNIIKVADGTYNETLTINKAVTIEGENGDSSNVVIKDATKGVNDGDGVVNIATSGVTLNNIKVINTTNLENVTSTKTQAAALLINSGCDNNAFNNCIFESVQDTVIINDDSEHASEAYDENTIRADFNNCTVLGKTDFVCGTGYVTFDDCTFEVVLYVHNSNNVSDDKDNLVYVFSPTPWSKFVVNGGSIVYDTDYNTDVNSTEDGFATPPTANLYYARIWDKSSLGSSDGETVNLYLNGVTSPEVNTTVKSMNGFYCQSINGTIPTTNAWLNLYNPAEGTPDNTNYTYSTHDANLFEFTGAMMDGNNIVLYGDFIAGTGTGYDKNEKVEDPVLATIREVGFIVDKTLTAESVTYDADKALSTSTLFTKLVKNTAEGTTEDVHTGNPYTTFCWIDVSGEEVTAENPIEFRLFTYTKYNSNDEYNISSDFATVTYDGTDVTVE